MSSNRDSAIRRLTAAVVLFVISGGAAWLVRSQPPEGTLRGSCIDLETSRPIPRCRVWLYRDTSEDGDSAEDHPGETTRNALGDTSAPPGWTQSMRTDSNLDFAGSASGSRDVLEVRSDARGWFVFNQVPAGSYRLSASAPGREYKDTPVTIEEGAATHWLVRLSTPPLSLGFQSAMPCWAPGARPVIGLDGVVAHGHVALSLDRINVDAALAQKPTALLSYLRSQDNAPPSPGLLTPCRRWTIRIAHPDPGGQFYQRISMDPLPEGLYRITAASTGVPAAMPATASILVTHLALVRKTVGSRILAFVTDCSSGRASPHVGVSLYEEGSSAPLASARTSPEGLVRLTPRGARAEGSGMLMARDGAGVALLPVELNSPGENGSNNEDASSDSDDSSSSGRPVRSFIYTDRPIYQPGQTVYLKGIERWVTSKRFEVPAGQAVALDIRDAQDTLVDHRELSTNDLGSWNTALSLSPEALTGEYTVRAALGGAVSTGSFAVAAYRKPEYAVTVSFGKDRYIRGDVVEAVLKASYYFGAPVVGAHVQVTVTKSDSGAEDGSRSRHAAAEDGPDSVSGEPVFTKTVDLNGSGEARIFIPTKDLPSAASRGGGENVGSPDESVPDAPGADQTLTVSASVDDTSGKSVEGSDSVVVGQGEFSLDVSAEPGFARTGDDVICHAAALKGAELPDAGQPLILTAGYESWTEGHSSRISAGEQHTITSSSGQARAVFKAEHEGLLVLRAAGRDRRGNLVTAETTLWVTGDGGEAPVHYPDLSVTLDRKKYQVGQTAHMLINVDHPGPSALVTVEGAHLYHAWVVPLRRRSTGFDLKVEAGFAPDVTLAVCCFRQRQFFQSESDLRLSDQRRTLRITLTTDRQRYHPHDLSAIHVRTTDAAGKAMAAELSLGVVDESIYAIRDDPPAAIQDAFEPEQPDSVNTENSCERIYLGDVDKGSAEIDVRKDFPDTALWQPVVRTGVDGTAVVRLRLPDSLTTWRITAVGHTGDTAVGKSTARFIVTRDLIVRLEQPGFLVQGDNSTIVAMVNNNTAGALHAHVSLDPGGLALNGSRSRDLEISPGPPARVSWQVTAPNAPLSPGAGAGGGDSTLPARVRVTVTAGKLSDGVEQPLILLPHGSTQDTWQSGTLMRRVVKRVNVAPDAISGSTTLTIRLAPTASSSLLTALDYLATYPYGSTDSTASTLISDAVISRAAGTGGSVAVPMSAARLSKLKEMTNRSLLRLYRFQRDEGGWGWWDAGVKESLWMTADATWALTLARDAGYHVSSKVLSAATSATARLSDEAISGSGATDPGDIGLAALALARGHQNAAVRSNIRYAMNCWSYSPQLNNGVIAMWALAAQETGDDILARNLMARIWRAGREMGGLFAWPSARGLNSSAADQDDADTEATAWSLLAAQAITPTDPRIGRVVRWLMANRSGDHWLCPATTAAVILGLSADMARSHEMQPDFTARVVCNGETISTVRFDVDSLSRPDVTVPISGFQLRHGSNTILLEKEGQGRLYYSLDLRQTLPQARPAPPPPYWRHVLDRLFRTRPTEPPFSPSGYRVKRVYVRLTSRRGFLWEDSVPVRENRFRTDESMLVRLIIDCVRPGSHIVVSDPAPPGCEITETPGDAAMSWDNWWDYTDVRADRVVFFISDLSRGEHEIDYHLRARTPGAYDVMPTSITGVFDPSLHASGRVDRIEIDGAEG